MARKVLILVAAVVVVGVVPALAQAAPVTLCVPSGAGAGVTTPRADGTCPTGQAKKSLATNADLAAANDRIAKLETLLAGVTRSSSGGVSTLKFSGMNVQVVSGSGQTDGAVNGKGNLIVGYDESRSGAKRTGSHNVIVGSGQSFSGYGSVVAGERNTQEGHGQLIGGIANTAVGADTSVTGGYGNYAERTASSVSGGAFNRATTRYGSVTGGGCNVAGPGDVIGGDRCNFPSADDFAAVTGGIYNQADSAYGSITGGGQNTTTGGSNGSITGGQANKTTGDYASITGGAHNISSGHWAVVSGGGCNVAGQAAVPVLDDCFSDDFSDNRLMVEAGGARNAATGFAAFVTGGEYNTASGEGAAVTGGDGNDASGYASGVSGGEANSASGLYASVLGGYMEVVSATSGTYPAGP